MKLNLKRTLLGGLAAGLTFTIGGLISALIMGLPDTFAEYGVAPSGSSALLHTGLRFGLGFAAIFLFAGMRKGLGRAPLTALLTAFLVWYIAYVPGTTVLHQLGVYDDQQLTIGLVWGLAETMVALLLGAWLFQDAGQRAAAASESSRALRRVESVDPIPGPPPGADGGSDGEESGGPGTGEPAQQER